MQISELAQQASVSVHALRHYERLGLIHPDRRANGYREDLQRGRPPKAGVRGARGTCSALP